MRVSLSHSEIQSAVVAELERRGVVTAGFDISVSFSMGRKGTGLTGTVDLDDPTITVLPPVVEAEAVVTDEPLASTDAPVVVASEDTPPFEEDKPEVPAPAPTPEPEVPAEPQEAPKSLFAL